jgi:hypothetical protein
MMSRYVTVSHIMKQTQPKQRAGNADSAKADSKSSTIASPEEVLAAAELAVPVFHIAKYYRPIRIMREKGYSWRDTAEFLHQFRIDISYVHLRRLFVEETKRLSKVNEQQLRKLGMHPDDIRERLEDVDPVDRLPAADPGDDDIDERDERP